MEKTCAIFLQLPWSFSDVDGGDPEAIPDWKIHALGVWGSEDEEDFSPSPKDWMRETQVEAYFCPFCGTPVPEIERAKTGRMKMYVPTYDGGYCKTCNERSMCCGCAYPERAWKPVK